MRILKIFLKFYQDNCIFNCEINSFLASKKLTKSIPILIDHRGSETIIFSRKEELAYHALEMIHLELFLLET